jgi:hypothetical protein
MPGGLITFLVAALILILVLYVFNLVLARTELPADIQQIAMVAIGVVGLIVLIGITLDAFGTGYGWRVY